MSEDISVGYAEAYEGQEVSVDLPEEAPFQVGEEVDLGDLNKIQRAVLPVARDVRFEILSSATGKTKSGNIKFIEAKLRIVGGIPTTNEEGELVMKYANKVVMLGAKNWKDLCLWHNPNGPDPNGWWKAQDAGGQEYKMGSKQFVVALGMAGKKINDEFHAAIVGKHVLGSIGHDIDKETGQVSEKYGNWKAAPAQEE